MQDLHCWQSKFNACHYSARLINKIILLNNHSNFKVNLNEVKKSIYYAKKYHGKQKRDTGEPYYSHPLEVAYMVSDYLFNTDILVTCILHDVIEDTNLDQGMIQQLFGQKIAKQVQSLTRINLNGKISVTEIITLLSRQKQEDLLLIKYFDRLHNLQTLSIKPTIKQREILSETLKEFLPIAAHLGILELEKKMIKICKKINFISQELSSQENFPFSFLDSYQPLFLAFQNA